MIFRKSSVAVLVASLISAGGIALVGSPTAPAAAPRTPTISTTSTIAVGQTNPQIVITTDDTFANILAFTVSPGGTGLSAAFAPNNFIRTSDTQATLLLQGVAAAGTLTVTVQGNSFNPAANNPDPFSITVGAGPAPGPAPTPVFPPSAPQALLAVSGDRSVAVTWSAPQTSGSFAISNYQVETSPGGRMCLVVSSITSCTITGLTNGTTYTVRARALNGAGWGAWSEQSPPFTPEAATKPTITITGARDDVRGRPGIVVTGTSTGMGEGALLTVWSRKAGEARFTASSTAVIMDARGRFTWERRVAKAITVYVATPDGTVESNRIRIAK